jgi:hypothetical protein
VCERAIGEGRTCDFRSGRTILQRPIDRAQMSKLLETGKTDLLQFVSARTRRPFSAYLVKQPDGKVGFEFEAKDPGRRGARPARGAPLRVLGKHPRDHQPVELHAGRYGPYVKHGATNATLPDRDAVDSLSLEQAVALVDEKAGRGAGTARRSVTTRAPRTAKPAAEASAPTNVTARRAAPTRGARPAKAPVAKSKSAVSRSPAAGAATSGKHAGSAATKKTRATATVAAKTKAPASRKTSGKAPGVPKRTGKAPLVAGKTGAAARKRTGAGRTRRS